MDKIEKLKKFLQENYPNIQAFNTRNIAGDYLENVYEEDDIQVDYCHYYDYIEIFGLSDDEFESLLENGHLKTFNKYKKQDKLDIQVGDLVTYKYLGAEHIKFITDRCDITELENKLTEIIKIERPKYEVVEEKKELLTEEEKEFLKLYMKLIGFEKDIEYIKKENDRFLYLILSDNSNFEIEVSEGDNFKRLKNNKEYTLKELGLEEK